MTTWTTPRRGEPLGGLHDHWCRCRNCKPPLVGQRTYWPELVGLALLAIAIGVAP